MYGASAVDNRGHGDASLNGPPQNGSPQNGSPLDGPELDGPPQNGPPLDGPEPRRIDESGIRAAPARPGGGGNAGVRLDPADVSALYVEHSEALRRFVFGLVRDHQLAADVLQWTFVRTLERGHTAQEESRKAWLFRVAFNEAMRIRRRTAVGDRVVRSLAWGRPIVGQAADAALVRGETVQRVREALDGLPAEQQQIVRMRIYDEKTFVEIAAELAIPLGTALSRMRSALAKLRSGLRQH
jgi:RNA polymerase sigma-70 factor (ECF subfamily)